MLVLEDYSLLTDVTIRRLTIKSQIFDVYEKKPPEHYALTVRHDQLTLF